MGVEEASGPLLWCEVARGNAGALLGRLCVMLNKLAIVLLLVGLAGLATAAKDGQYYPKANPAHQVSVSTKMNVNSIPVVSSQTPLQKVAQVVVSKPRPSMHRPAEAEVPRSEPISVTVSLQHRSPPAVLP
jgi:nitrogen fixation-related uncharacterized protein